MKLLKLSTRPQMTWRTSSKGDLHRMNLTWHGAWRAANNRSTQSGTGGTKSKSK